MLHEGQNNNRARALYSQVITEFPTSQFRVQAEDRMYAMRASVEAPATPPVTATPTPTQTTPVITNETVNRYEDLTSGSFYIQFGVFSTENAARNYVSTLNRDGVTSFVITKPVEGRRLFAVVQGPFSTRADVQAAHTSFVTKNIQSFFFRKD